MNKIERNIYAHGLSQSNMSPKSMSEEGQRRLRHYRENPDICSFGYAVAGIVMSLEGFFKEARQHESKQ